MQAQASNKTSQHSSLQDFLRGKSAVSTAVPWLVLSVYALLLLSRLLDSIYPNFLDRESEYLGTIILQLVIFPIPTYIYLRLREKERTLVFKSRIKFRSVKLSHLFLLLSAVLILICGCTLLALLCGMMTEQVSFTLYNTFKSSFDGTALGGVKLILAYGILPAIFEELIFRGIVCAEYEKYGILYSSLISALLFAFLHFDISAFPVYLFAGLILAFVMYITHSVICTIFVHLGYNLFGIFAQAGLSGYCRSTGSVGLLVILLIAFLLLGSAFFCGEVSRILRGRAESDLLADATEIITPGINNLKRHQWLPAIRSAFATPTAILCVLLWLIAVIFGIIERIV